MRSKELEIPSDDRKRKVSTEIFLDVIILGRRHAAETKIVPGTQFLKDASNLINMAVFVNTR